MKNKILQLALPLSICCFFLINSKLFSQITFGTYACNTPYNNPGKWEDASSWIVYVENTSTPEPTDGTWVTATTPPNGNTAVIRLGYNSLLGTTGSIKLGFNLTMAAGTLLFGEVNYGSNTAGNIVLENNATLTIGGSVDHFNFNGSGSIIFTSTASVIGGAGFRGTIQTTVQTGANLTVQDFVIIDGSFTNYGTINFTSAVAANAVADAQFINETTGVMNGAFSFQWGGGTASCINRGTVNATNWAYISNTTIAFENSGTFNITANKQCSTPSIINSGTLNIGNNVECIFYALTSTGTLSVGTNAVLRSGGSPIVNISGNLANNGLISTFNINFTGSNSQTISGTNGILQARNIGFLNTSTTTVNGTQTLDAHTLIGTGSTLTIANTGSLSQSNAQLTINGTLNNHGTLNKTTYNEIYLNGTLNNATTGIINSQARFTLNANFVNNGIFYNTGSGYIRAETDYTITGSGRLKNNNNGTIIADGGGAATITLTINNILGNTGGTIGCGQNDVICFPDNPELLDVRTCSPNAVPTLCTATGFTLVGIIYPGCSPGKVIMTPSLASTPTSVYDMEITGGYGVLGTADDADKIESPGNITLNGKLQLSLNNPDIGTYIIFNSTGGTVSGFSNLSVLYSVNGGAFSATRPPNTTIQINSNNIIVNITGSILPVELLTFSVQHNEENKTQLNWQTASEIKVKNFDIEKSLNGKTFEKIAEIKANNTPSVYQTFDDQFSESAYYRLKINDLDGTSNYSKTIYLEKNSDKTLQIIRDTEGSVLIETNDKIELITITNSIGQLIKSTKEIRFLIDELNSGIYIISVKTDKGFLSKKIFKE